MLIVVRWNSIHILSTNTSQSTLTDVIGDDEAFAIVVSDYDLATVGSKNGDCDGSRVGDWCRR